MIKYKIYYSSNSRPYADQNMVRLCATLNSSICPWTCRPLTIAFHSVAASNFLLHSHELSVKEEKACVANGGTSSYAAVNDVVLHVVSVFI